ncbi:hypothetical protein ID866_9393 [Astraeus odoratus]|nr:hypothetical protein ID866_9393 [Astraeus odoratus]
MRPVEHARKSHQDPAKYWPEDVLALCHPGRHVGELEVFATNPGEPLE